jgi:hypothetical protein
MVLSNLVSLAIYGLGSFIIYQAGWVWMVVYLVYLLILEIRLLGGHCRHCYYYGRTCAFGKGRLSAAIFKPGDPERFNARSATWRSMIPDILVVLVPMVVGIVDLARDFSWAVLAVMLGILVLATVGNGAVRSSLACSRCRQRELGCPAERLFAKAGTEAG